MIFMVVWFCRFQRLSWPIMICDSHFRAKSLVRTRFQSRLRSKSQHAWILIALQNFFPTPWDFLCNRGLIWAAGVYHIKSQRGFNTNSDQLQINFWPPICEIWQKTTIEFVWSHTQQSSGSTMPCLRLFYCTLGVTLRPGTAAILSKLSSIKRF